jgi:hypothetical protein
MGNTASLRLLLVTQEGKPLNEPVEIHLRDDAQGLHRILQHDASGPILLEGLAPSPQGQYSLDVIPSSFKAESRIHQVLAEGLNELWMIFGQGGKDDDDNGEDRRPCPPLKVPNQLDEKILAAQLTVRLAGTSADGTAASAQLPDTILWIDNGDEVLVHLDSLRTAILDGMILVSIDLETDQTGRATMVVPFAVGKPGDPAGLVAVTEEFPRGNGVLASRWGSVIQAAAWSSLLSLANDHASERFASPLGIAAQKGSLSLQAGAPLRITGVTR